MTTVRAGRYNNGAPSALATPPDSEINVGGFRIGHCETGGGEWERLFADARQNDRHARQPAAGAHFSVAPALDISRGGIDGMARRLGMVLDPNAELELWHDSAHSSGPFTVATTRLRLLSGPWAGLVIELCAREAFLHVRLLPQEKHVFEALTARCETMQAALGMQLATPVKLDVELVQC